MIPEGGIVKMIEEGREESGEISGGFFAVKTEKGFGRGGGEGGSKVEVFNFEDAKMGGSYKIHRSRYII